MNAIRSLLATAICSALCAGTSFAQPTAGTAVDAGDADAATLEGISVIGKGETRQVQELDIQAQAQKLPAGTSPLKLLSKLPGVSFQSADPFGNYEWSTRISIRGFGQNQLGFTLDGVPLGDMSYGNHNGMHISRAVAAENLQRVELAQGAGAIATASTSNLGGTAQFFTRTPEQDFGVRVAQSFGSDSAWRTFASMDSGQHGGFSSYLSFAFADTDKWKGAGDQEQSQFNGKLVYGNEWFSLAGYVSTSRRNEIDYADLSLESQHRLGWDWDNYQPDWQRAIDAANGIYSGAANSLDDAYYTASGLRDDDMASVNLDWQATDAIAVQMLAYYHRNEGQGTWATPYRPSPTVPISIRTTEYDIERTGFIPSISATFGINTVSAGIWFENSVHGLQRNFYNLDRNNPPDESFFHRDPDLRVFRQRFDTDTTQYFISDRIDLLEGALAIDVGFKGTDVDIDAISLIGSRAGGSIESKDSFLPQIAARYQFNDNEEIFSSYTKNMAAFRPGVGGPFSASQSAFNLFADTLEPETSDTFELGLRSERDWYQASIALYNVRFDNRLLSIARCAGIVGCPSSFANVGKVQSNGVEAALALNLSDEINWYHSVSYNDSEYRSDYLDGENLVPAGGKQVVGTPQVLFTSDLSYTSGPLSAGIIAQYTDERFITYLNDSKVEDFWLLSASAGYDFGEVGAFKALKLQLQVTNLLEKEYFSTVGSNGFVTSDPNGNSYTLLTGAPRQWFFAVDANF
ncbi:MAG: TonB-dependent receptor [Pseudomonadota bacterium]|nr:TonB-dependent receptor [Pseudomonadota bacterium]